MLHLHRISIAQQQLLLSCPATRSRKAIHRRCVAPAATKSLPEIDGPISRRDVAVKAVAASPAVMDMAPAAIDAAALPKGICSSGLNGLSACGTDGLDSGIFTVASAQPVSYSVEETHKLFDVGNKSLIRALLPNSFPARLGPEPSVERARRFVIIDETVNAVYGRELEQYFQFHNVDYEILALPTNEPNKSFNLVFQVAEALEKFKLNRRKEPIIAIGGGVCLDVAGLAANLYRRNTPLIKVPTTVMGAVDASIGIKTAVNFHGRKNKMGTYCPPLAVFIDNAFLATLPARHLSNGAAEILKMACVKDGELFLLLEQHASALIGSHFQSPAASCVMRRSIQGMLEELEYNLWEHILVRLVDYGHTFSPEIEMAALVGDQAKLLHGEAVNIDMALTTQLAFQRGLITGEQRDRVYNVMMSLGLALWDEVCTLPVLMKGLQDTTLQRDGLQRVPLMTGIGNATFVNDLTETEVAAAAAYVANLHLENSHRYRSTHLNPLAQNSIVPTGLRPEIPEAAQRYVASPA